MATNVQTPTDDTVPSSDAERRRIIGDDQWAWVYLGAVLAVSAGILGIVMFAAT